MTDPGACAIFVRPLRGAPKQQVLGGGRNRSGLDSPCQMGRKPEKGKSAAMLRRKATGLLAETAGLPAIVSPGASAAMQGRFA